jgi:hypothetical protein
LKQTDKVVFSFKENSQARLVMDDVAHNTVISEIERMLTANKVSTDVVFIGGCKKDLVMYLSGLIELYNIRINDIIDMTINYENDIDFNI